MQAQPIAPRPGAIVNNADFAFCDSGHTRVNADDRGRERDQEFAVVECISIAINPAVNPVVNPLTR